MEADVEMSVEKIENKSDDSSDSEDSEDSNKSDDDDDNDAEDEQTKNKIAELQQTISSNVYNYNPHVELIKLLRKNGDLDELTSARERMSSIFPLTEELWLEWLRDEMKLAEFSDRSKVINLFERAVKDYMSVAIWLEYVQYSIGGMGEPGGMEAVRETFERGLTAIGINVSGGAMLWEAYREFECAVLAGLQPAPGAVATGNELKQIEIQTGRITRLFHRQLSVPLIDMEKTFDEYKEWIDGEVESDTLKKYKKTLSKLKQILPFEDSLRTSDPPHLSEYTAYIEHETKEGDPVRVMSLYERAITDNCLQAHLWMQYVRYLESTVKSADIVVPVYERALRNCPWVVDLWTGSMFALEQLGQGHDRVLDVFNRALASGFTQGCEFLRLWTAYLDYLRRRVHWNKDHETELEALRVAFEQAVCHLTQNYPVDGDTNGTLTQYWAFIEAKFCRNMSKARELWSAILQSGLGSQAQICLEYVRLERAYGDQKHCRKLLQRIVNSVSDWPETVCDEYIKFEREEGDLESYLEAVHRCDMQLKKIQERRAKEAEKEAQAAEQKKTEKAQKKQQAKNMNKKPSVVSQDFSTQPSQEIRPYNRSRPPPGAPPPKSRPPPGAPPPKSADVPFKAPHTQTPPSVETASSLASDSSNAVVYVRGQKRKLPEDVAVLNPTDTDSVQQIGTTASAAAAAAVGVFKSPPPPGYKPKATTENTAKKAKVDDEASASNELLGVGDNGSQSGGSSQRMVGAGRQVGGASKDSCTVFISNLDFSVTSKEIEDIFTKVGELSEVRLITNFKGRSKGFAYVEFKDEFPVSEALKLDRILISGRPMFVSPCNPGADTGQKFKFGTGLEKSKLFIKGLPFTTTTEELKQIFGAHGKLKEVRIVTYRNGKPKGLAYVEYDSEVSAAQAVLKLDGHVINEHTISVAISNPPSRNSTAEASFSTFVPSLGGGKKQTAEHGKARTQLSLLPRSVQRQPSTAHTVGMETVPGSGTEESKTGADTSAAGSLSNDDFRNMLLRR